MAHLKYFGVSNFRNFKGITEFNLKPITILTGTNSSGKSSLLKALLLFKNTFDGFKLFNYSPYKDGNKDDSEFLDTIDFKCIENIEFTQNLQIGNFATCINKDSNSNLMEFRIPFNISYFLDDTYMKLTYKIDGTQLKNAKLFDLKLINKSNNEELLRYYFEDDCSKIMVSFSGFWNSIKSYNDFINQPSKFFKDYIDAATKYINLEDATGLLSQRLGYTQEQDIDYSDVIKLLPTDILDQIDEQKEIRRNIYSFFSKKGAGISIGANGQLFGISDEVDNYMIEYFPLFTYIFLFRDETIRENINTWFPEKSEDEVHDIYNECIAIQHKLFEIIGTNDINVAREYIANCELKTLDKMTFTDNSKQFDYLDLRGLSYLFKRIINNVFYTEELEDHEDSYIPRKRKISQTLSEYYSFIKTNSEELKPFFGHQDLLILDDFTFGKIEKSTGVKINNLKQLLINGIYNGFGSQMNNLSNTFKSISYIPSVRAKVQRVYNIGFQDSYLHQIIHDFNNIEISQKARLFLNKYLNIFNISEGVELNVSDDSAVSRITFLRNGESQNLADFGYGISQVLPILLRIALKVNELVELEKDPTSQYLDNSIIIIIEEPETNLHPALQSKLADLFVDCYNTYDFQMIIETHSEYLIRKLQYLTAKSQIKSDKIKIYYFYPPGNVPEGEGQVKEIDINEDGSLTNDFGSGFFDEADKIAMSIWSMNQSQKN